MGKIKVKENRGFYYQLENNGKWKKELEPAYKEYRRKWVENPLNFIIEKAPIDLDIEVSSVCNLKCPMCLRTIDLQKEDSKIKEGIMDWQLWTKIIDEAAEIGVSSIKLNWRGEPTTNPKLVDMVRYAKEKKILDVMFNTNGVFLDETLARDLINAGLDNIFFSIDSIIPEKYEQIRIGAKYENVIENIKRFTAINEELGHPVFVRVQKVLMKDTDDENEDYKKFFSKIVDQVAFSECVPYVDGSSFGEQIIRQSNGFACQQLWQRMTIAWNGDCSICCWNMGDPLVVGNVSEQSIAEMWNCDKIKEIRELHKQGLWYKIDICKKCGIPYMQNSDV